MPSITVSCNLIIATPGDERSAHLVPRDKLRAAGGTVHVASTDGAPIRNRDNADRGDCAGADPSLADADVARDAA